MHLMNIVKTNDPTSTVRKGVEKRIDENDKLSVAEKRHLFEQLATPKLSNITGTRWKNDHARQPPPPKPVRTFAHDEYLNTKLLTDSSRTKSTSIASSSPNSARPKPSVAARRRPKIATKNGTAETGVSHEYEHIFTGRSPMVLRYQNLRRSMSDDPVAYAQSIPLKITTTDIEVAPLYYASSPVPRQSTIKKIGESRIYDTPASNTNGSVAKSKSSPSKLHRRPRDSLPLNHQRQEELDDDLESSQDADLSSVDVDKRVNRARLMRRRTLMHYDQQEIAFIKRQLPQLFELAALVRLEPNDGSNPMLSRDQKYAPTVVFKFPTGTCGKSDDGSIMASLSCLCYPDISKAVLTSPETYKDEQFVMTITDQFGDRKFVYCYRFVPMATVMERSNDRLSPTGRLVKAKEQCVAPSSSTFFCNEILLNGLPQVFCVVTPVQAPNFYSDFVREAAMKVKLARTDSDDLVELREFLKETFWKPLPPPGRRLIVNGRCAKEITISHRISSSRGIMNGISTLVERIGIDHAMLLFTALLSERRVLLVGDSVPSVSKAVQAAAALLTPFEWPHTFVPVVPDPYVHLCFSPTPYLMGLLRSNLHFLKDLLVGRRTSAQDQRQVDEEDEEYILILDLDYGILKDKDFYDDTGSVNAVHRCLPPRTARNLRHELKLAISTTPDCAMATATSLMESKDAKIADAFVITFIDLIGHYKEFLVTQQDGQVTFQKQQFVNDAVSAGQRLFLKWFVETGMFQVWLKKKLDAATTGSTNAGQRKSMTLGTVAASDTFDRKLDQLKSRRSPGSAAYQFLVETVARKWTSFIRRK